MIHLCMTQLGSDECYGLLYGVVVMTSIDPVLITGRDEFSIDHSVLIAVAVNVLLRAPMKISWPGLKLCTIIIFL